MKHFVAWMQRSGIRESWNPESASLLPGYKRQAWRCCIGSDDQKQATVIGITRQVLFSTRLEKVPAMSRR